MRRLIIAATLVVLAAPAARADCTALANGIVPYDISNPAGAVTMVTQPTTTATALVQGVLAYDTTVNLLKVCNGTTWQPLGTNAPGGTSGQIQFNNTGAFGADSGLFWDNSNKRLGVGTATPSSMLSLVHATDIWSGLTVSETGVNGEGFSIWHYGGPGSGTELVQEGVLPIRFITNAIERMRINGNGNVGIGTTGAGPTGVFASGTALQISQTAAPQFPSLRLTTTNNDTSLAIDDTSAYLYTNKYLRFYVGSTPAEAMRIDSSGKVGIGTASPLSALNVQNGSINVGTYGAPSTGTGIRMDTTGDLWMQQNTVDKVHLAVAGTSYMNGGNVGIGTTSPATMLEVDSGTAISSIKFGNSSGNGYLSVGKPGCFAGYLVFGRTLNPCGSGNDLMISPTGTVLAKGGIALNANNGISDASNGAYALVIRNSSDKTAITNNNNYVFVADSSGKVGIGTSAPARKFVIQDTDTQFSVGDKSGYAASYGPIIETNSDAIVMPTRIFIKGSNSYLITESQYSRLHGDAGVKLSYYVTGVGLSVGLTMDNTGKVGIGTSAPNATLDVNGYAKLKKNTAAPVTCSATYDGSIALTSTTHMCVCDGTSWVDVDGRAACAW